MSVESRTSELDPSLTPEAQDAIGVEIVGAAPEALRDDETLTAVEPAEQTEPRISVFNADPSREVLVYDGDVSASPSERMYIDKETGHMFDGTGKDITQEVLDAKAAGDTSEQIQNHLDLLNFHLTNPGALRPDAGEWNDAEGRVNRSATLSRDEGDRIAIVAKGFAYLKESEPEDIPEEVVEPQVLEEIALPTQEETNEEGYAVIAEKEEVGEPFEVDTVKVEEVFRETPPLNIFERIAVQLREPFIAEAPQIVVETAPKGTEQQETNQDFPVVREEVVREKAATVFITEQGPSTVSAQTAEVKITREQSFEVVAEKVQEISRNIDEIATPPAQKESIGTALAVKKAQEPVQAVATQEQASDIQVPIEPQASIKNERPVEVVRTETQELVSVPNIENVVITTELVEDKVPAVEVLAERAIDPLPEIQVASVESVEKLVVAEATEVERVAQVKEEEMEIAAHEGEEAKLPTTVEQELFASADMKMAHKEHEPTPEAEKQIRPESRPTTAQERYELLQKPSGMVAIAAAANDESTEMVQPVRSRFGIRLERVT